MKLISLKLEALLNSIDIRNTELKYGLNDVRGINNEKHFITTHASLDKRDLSTFKIVRPGDFVFNHRTSRNGDKLSITYNDTNQSVICTNDYIVFYIKEIAKNIIKPIWLYMFFNRPEFDRYVIINSWGSATELFNWSDMCDIDIELPPVEIQQKYIDIYLGLLKNQQCYENGLDDLKLTIDAHLDRLKNSARYLPLGKLLKDVDIRNEDSAITSAEGINIEKKFMPSKVASEDLRRYKIVRKNQFACNLMHVGRDVKLPISLMMEERPIIVSPAYSVLKRISNNVREEFIQMWLSRSEIDRKSWFMSDDSIRGNLNLDRLLEIKIPVPSLNMQDSLVNIYKAYVLRRDINEKLKEQIKNICPILIKGSIEEARG